MKHYILPNRELPEGSFLLAAPPGRGKTCWLEAMAAEAVESGISCNFISARRHGQVPEIFLSVFAGNSCQQGKVESYPLNTGVVDKAQIGEMVLIDDAFALGALHNFPTFAPTLRHLGKIISSRKVIVCDSFPELAEKVLHRMGIFLPVVYCTHVQEEEIKDAVDKTLPVKSVSRLCGDDLALLWQLAEIWPENADYPDIHKLLRALKEPSDPVWLYLALVFSNAFGLARGDGLLRYSLTRLCWYDESVFLPEISNAVGRGKPTVRNLFVRLAEVGLTSIDMGRYYPPYPLMSAWIRINEGGENPQEEELLDWLGCRPEDRDASVAVQQLAPADHQEIGDSRHTEEAQPMPEESQETDDSGHAEEAQPMPEESQETGDSGHTEEAQPTEGEALAGEESVEEAGEYSESVESGVEDKKVRKPRRPAFDIWM